MIATGELTRGVVLMGLVGRVLCGQSPPADAPTAPAVVLPASMIPPDATEQSLIEHVRQLRELLSRMPAGTMPDLSMQQGPELIAFVDALVQRFPNSTFRDEALVHKLQLLGELARFHPEYLAQLRTATDQIAASKPSGALASENAYFAIQAFVLAARAEDMPGDRRLLGAMERYKAFVEDYKDSPRRPVIWASWIRDAIVLRRVDEAAAELVKLQKEYPGHEATHRARGELYRATGVGQPFSFRYTSANGDKVDSQDFRGKVLLVHFWANWSNKSVEELDLLRRLHEELAAKGLQLVAVNVDAGRTGAEAAVAQRALPWPQYYDARGLKNDLLVGLGVIRVPTYFLVDRAGVLRAIDPPGLEASVRGLVMQEGPLEKP